MVNLNCAINQKVVFNNKEEGIVNSVKDNILYIQIGDKEKRFDISAVTNGYLVFVNKSIEDQVNERIAQENKSLQKEREKKENEIVNKVFVYYDEFIGYTKEKFDKLKKLFTAVFYEVDFTNEEIISSDSKLRNTVKKAALGAKFSLIEYDLQGISYLLKKYDRKTDSKHRSVNHYLWDEMWWSALVKIEQKGLSLKIDRDTIDAALRLFYNAVECDYWHFRSSLTNMNIKKLTQIARENYKKCKLWENVKYGLYAI